MPNLTRSLSALVLIALLASCGQLTPPEPPPDEVLEQGMLQALMDTGFYQKVAISRKIGKHYRPDDRAWTIFACFRFSVPSGEQAETCVDSFRALALDSGDWVVAVTIEGVYRWRAISAGGESTGTAGDDATAASGT